MLVKEDKLYIFLEEMKYLKHTQLASSRTQSLQKQGEENEMVSSFIKEFKTYDDGDI